jgi:Flp pilus assembly protein CpaB
MGVRALTDRIAVPGVDRRTILGIGLAAAAAALVLIVTRPPGSTPVLVAGSDLPAGTPLAELDVAVRSVTDAGGHVVGDEVGELADWSLRVPLAAGEPIVPSLLQPPQVLAATSLLSLELASAHAVLGRLAPGDLIDVYATSRSSVGESETTKVAESVFVVDTQVTPAATGDRVALLLAVDDGLAARLAAAARSGDLDIVRVGP